MSLEWTLFALRLLAVAVLYAFLLVTVYVIWRDLRSAGRAEHQDTQGFTAVEQPAVPAGWLRVIGGVAPLQPGDTFALQLSTSLGRSPDNHIVLPDNYVSSFHARMERRDGEWWLTDLGSRNGTRLNDVPLTKPAPLANGDVIGIGRVELRLEIGD